MAEATHISPGAKTFYSLNDLYDDLGRMTLGEIEELLREISHRVQDSKRSAFMVKILRAYLGYEARTD